MLSVMAPVEMGIEPWLVFHLVLTNNKEGYASINMVTANKLTGNKLLVFLL